MESRVVSGIILTLLLIGMLSLAFNIQPAKASLTVHNIDTGEDFATIQEAIDDADTLDGHTVLVDAGTYYENVVVNKAVSLVGENREITVIDGSGTGSVVTVTANNTMISEFTIRESGKPALEYTPSTDTGILVFAGYGQVVENSTIINNDIKDNYAGVFIWYSLGNTVANNKIENNFIGIGIDESISNNIFCNTVSNNDGGIWLGSGGNNVSSNIVSSNLAYGVEIDGSSFNTVDGNVIEYNEYGIYLDGSDSNTISGNILTNNDGGLILKFSGNNTLRNNNMTDNRWNFAVSGDSISDFDNDIDTSNLVDGKSVHYLVNQSNLTIDTSTFPDVGYLGIVNSKNVTVKDLSLTKNAQGVLFAFTDYSTIENVNVSKNWVGIQFWESDANTVSSNIISSNSIGIILDFCDGNTIYHNNFISNELHAGTYESYSNVWDNGYPSGGNYWDDYSVRYPSVKDEHQGENQDVLGSDGMWDSPYEIDDDNQDRYPLVEPWSPLPRTIDELKIEIEELGSQGEIDNRGIIKSLIRKLNVAQKLVDKGKIDEAKSVLEDDFIPQVQNLSGIHITVEAADILIQSAEYILSHL